MVERMWSKGSLLGLGLGQFVSLLITSTGFSSSELARRGIDAPTSQSFANYVLLAIVYGSWMLYRKKSLQEFVVKNADRIELMAMLGIFGAIVSACQISILERNELASIHWTKSAVLPFIGFAVAMFMFYSTVPVVLKISGSTMLNLSLLTSDMWAVLIRIFAYHEKVDWMYFIAFAAVAVGLVIYSCGGSGDETMAEIADGGDRVDKERDVEAAADGLGEGSAASGSTRTGDGKHHSAPTDLPK